GGAGGKGRGRGTTCSSPTPQLRQPQRAAGHHAGVAVYLRCTMATFCSRRSAGPFSRSRGLALAFGSWQPGLVSRTFGSWQPGLVLRPGYSLADPVHGVPAAAGGDLHAGGGFLSVPCRVSDR
ncbi:unnamed protein product, partial [Laminaria digitata]